MYVRIDLIRPLVVKEKNTEIAKQIFSLKEKFITSSANLIRLMFDLEAKKTHLDFLKKLKRIKLIPISEKIVKAAINYKEKYDLSVFDSIDVATCIAMNEKLLSFEMSFQKIPKIKVVNPSELLGHKTSKNSFLGLFSR